jgi:hypothetical protein
LGISPRRCGARVQKRGGRQRASRPSYQPHWGFPFPLLLRGRREREEEGGVAAAPGRGGTRPHRHTDDAPGEERAAAAPRRERKEPGTRSREHGPELRETFAGVNTYSTGNAYTALNTIAMPPTTPSRPRLHCRPTVSTARPLYSLLPLGFLPVLDPRRRDASPLFLAWVLAIEPQNCRAATNGAPGPLVPLSAAVAVR